MNPNLYNLSRERVPSYLFISTGTAPMHPIYQDPRELKVNPSEYRKFEKIQEKVQKKKAATPPVSPTEAPILLFQGQLAPSQPAPSPFKKHK